MRKLILLFAVIVCSFQIYAQTNPSVQSIPYSQDFSTLAHASTAYPAGWQGWTISTTPGGVFNTNAPTADRLLVASSSASINSGNVHNYNGKIGFLNTGSLDLSLVLAVDGTGKNNIQIAYDIMTIRNVQDASNTRINEVTLQYRIGTTGAFTNLTGIEYQNNNVNQTGTGVTTPQNLQSKIITLPASCNNQPVIQIRWASRQVSGGGSRPSFAVDNIVINENTSLPVITGVSPANGSTGISVLPTATATFNTNIIKGTGNIVVKRVSDNSVIQTINVTSAAVSVLNNTASFIVGPLAYSTAYYIEMDAGTFTDGTNSFNGITGSSTWSFTTQAVPPAGIIDNNYSFTTCNGPLPDGFSQYSVLGPQVWGCTTFGRDPLNLPLGSAANGMQINGFSGTNILNEDWLISPVFDLSATTFPLLSFWSRTRFNGAPLQLKISTNYPGYGNPNSSTWVDLNGKFPAQTSDAWTLSNNINLSAYKTTGVYIAFVYSSTNDDGARWTLDDIQITNSATPPPPSLTLSTTDIQFPFTAVGNNTDKTFTVIGNDLTGDIVLTSLTTDFTLSTNPAGPFNSTITLLQGTYNNVPAIIYTRFSPLANNQNITGSLTVSTTSVSPVTVSLKGTSIDPANTLEVVNWNLEWFGSTTAGQGPTDKNQQQANVQTILQNIGADIYGLVEVVDESRLAAVVGNMPGYSYVICNYGSHTNPNSPTPSPLSGAQKQAFVYKTALFSNISTAPLVSEGINSPADISNPAYNYFSSGRFPFMMKADVTLNGITKTIRFVLVHAKANTSPTVTSYNRRKSGSDTLQYTLNNLYPNDNIIVLGDFNDDLDQTITDGITPPTTSYIAFINDNVNFSEPTLSLSLAGKKSTVGYNDMIDHVVVSNEMSTYYMNNTASVLTDVTSLVSNYGNTTTDHYPIFSRFTFSIGALPLEWGAFSVTKSGTSSSITWSTLQESNTDYFMVERSNDARTWSSITKIKAAGNSNSEINYYFTDASPVKGRNFYRIRQFDLDGKSKATDIRSLVFTDFKNISFFPNPATDRITLQSSATKILSVRIIDAEGRILIQQNVNQTTVSVDVKALKPGMYMLQIVSSNGVSTEKFVKQ